MTNVISAIADFFAQIYSLKMKLTLDNIEFRFPLFCVFTWLDNQPSEKDECFWWKLVKPVYANSFLVRQDQRRQ